VIDALAVHKDAEGEVEGCLSNRSTDEAIELGSKVGVLIGLGFEGEPVGRPEPRPGLRLRRMESPSSRRREEEAWGVLSGTHSHRWLPRA
jgi:hypothetical protein